MSYPKDAIAENSELPLSSLVTLMRIAAEQPMLDAVAIQLPREHLDCIKPVDESAFDYLGRRRLRINELCKEALPWMTMIYELRSERDQAREDAINAREEARKANDRADHLSVLLREYAPESFINEHDMYP